MRTLEGLWLDRTARATLQDQLARQIKELIQRGVIAPGEALPSTRELATGLKVSRNTAVYAYDRLTSEGYLESLSRSGVFVSSSITLSRHSKWPPGSMSTSLRSRVAPLAIQLGAPAPFRPCQPDVALFPLLIWNRMRGRILRREGRNVLHYQAACISGLPALRENVAAYLRDSRGVRCDGRQVVITSGSQQALFILATLLLRPSDQVYMEDPGYVEARLAWQSAGARIRPGIVDEQGLRLPGTRAGRVSLIYTTPSRQFPTGVSLSLARRLALIDFAGRTKSWVIEDDYDSELRYSAPPLPSLQSLDRSGRVIYVGTFSKLLFPSLRLGYAVIPEPLLDGFNELKHLIDDHLPLIDQATLAEFLESGAFYSHIRRCRKAYAERQALFLRLFKASDLPLRFEHTDGGMNLTGFLPAGTDDAAWSEKLGRAGFDVPPLSRYALGATRPGLVFGFTAFSPDLIQSSFERMCAVLLSAGLVTRAAGQDAPSDVRTERAVRRSRARNRK
ncbi:MAG TPA: PLP-dependent aminotransferase family protein [Vicinamibacterales bacterium]|jgi:GntR family transcriptional regulator/MocR family aminotransferase